MKLSPPKGTDVTQRFWMKVWNLYDTPFASRFITNKIAPWLFGKAIGAKGTKIS